MDLESILKELEGQGTYYDRENGIKVKRIVRAYDGKNLKILVRELGNGRYTYIWVYRVGIKGDNWYYWVPLEDQVTDLLEISPIVKDFVDRMNEANLSGLPP